MASTGESSFLAQEELHLSALTEAEHKTLVDSALLIKKNVVKLVEKETAENKGSQRLGLGTAFVVHTNGVRSLLLSCAHVIEKLDAGTFVARFTAEGQGQAPDCAIKVIAVDEGSDLLLFSIEGGPPGLEALEFSMEPVRKYDKVVSIGYSFMILPHLSSTMLIINEPSIMTGKILVDSFDMNSKKPNYTCKRGKAISDTRCTGGNSGSPVLREGKVVAVHCGADAAWRESATADRVLKFLKGHLKKRNTKFLLQEIADAEPAPQTSKSKREDDREKTPQTCNPDRWIAPKVRKTYTRLRHRKPRNGSADDNAGDREDDRDKTPPNKKSGQVD